MSVKFSGIVKMNTIIGFVVMLDYKVALNILDFLLVGKISVHPSNADR